MDVWDVFLIAGAEYRIVFNPSGAGSELLLFQASGSESWAAQSSSELELTTTPFHVAPTTGFYGLMVVGDEGTRDSHIGGTAAAVSVEHWAAWKRSAEEKTSEAEPMPELVALGAMASTTRRWPSVGVALTNP